MFVRKSEKHKWHILKLHHPISTICDRLITGETTKSAPHPNGICEHCLRVIDYYVAVNNALCKRMGRAG